MKRALSNPYLIITCLLLFGVGFYIFFKRMLQKAKTSVTDRNVQAFIMMIRKCEGTAGPNGYRTMFGGKLFTDMSKHPNVCVPYGNTCSTAAGAGQFLYRTWQEIAAEMDLPDFSEASQNMGFARQFQKRGALDDIIAGRISTAIYKCRKEWASLPGAGYGQPEKTLAFCLSAYQAAGGKVTA